ncbi:MAG: clan AA aspartic protease [Bacteroidales bacterium]|nr:clan AA aspartic protease [Bacteroidales bacterium]
MKIKKALFLAIYAVILLNMCSCLVVREFKYNNLTKEITIKNHDFVDTIPFQTVNGHIIIEVRINGKPKKYRFILDSGAGSHLFSHVNQGNEYTVLMKQKALDFNGHFFTYDVISIDKIQIGDLEFSNIPVANSKFPFECGEKFDGLIGPDIIHLANWQIDYENNIIIVTDDIKSLHFGIDTICLPVFVNQFSYSMEIPVTANSLEFKNVKVDMGAALGLFLNNRSSKKLIEEGKLNSYVKGFGIAGESLSGKQKAVNKYRGVIDSLQLSTSEYIMKDVYFVSGRGLNTIGDEFLANFRVTLDYDRAWLILEPRKENYHPSFESNYGFDYSFEKNKLVVTSLIEKTPAHDEGISIGDIIIEINGQDVLNCDHDTYCNLDIYQADSASLVIQKPSGENCKFTLHKKNMAEIFE